MKKIILSAMLALSSISAHAELVVSDFRTAGDKGIVTDTLTGIEYLNLTQTRGMSLSQFSSNAAFSDFEIADRTVVATLLDGYIGVPTSNLTNEIGVNDDYRGEDYFSEFANAFGLTTSDHTPHNFFFKHVIGMYNDNDGVEHEAFGVYETYTDNQEINFSHNIIVFNSGRENRYTQSYTSPYLGVWAVRTTSKTNYLNSLNSNTAKDVSAPFLVGTMGMLFLAYRVRKKSNIKIVL